jgi:hypothetical protein
MEAEVPSPKPSRRRPPKLRKESGRDAAEPGDQHGVQADPALGQNDPAAGPARVRTKSTEDGQQAQKSNSRTREAGSVSPKSASKRRHRPTKLELRSNKKPKTEQTEQTEQMEQMEQSIIQPIPHEFSALGSPIEHRVTALEQRVDGLDDRLDDAVLQLNQLEIKTTKAQRRRRARKPKPLVTESAHGDDEMSTNEADVEEIPRTSGPELEQNSKKPLVMRGKYTVPLPPTVSREDVQTVQQGARVATTIAREIHTAFRANVRTSQDITVDRNTSWTGLFSQAAKTMVEAINAVDLETATQQPRNRRSRQTGNSYKSH